MMPTMKDIKPLYIPATKKWKGLTVYCYKCRTNVSETCKENDKPLNKCLFGDKHAFKVYIHVPGTENNRKTKTLGTRDVNEAIKEAMEFEKEVKNSNLDITEKNTKKVSGVVKKENSKPQLLIHALARYVGFLNNEGVPAHRVKVRSRDHIKDVERAFTNLVQCLTNSGHNIGTFNVNEINDNVAGEVFEYLRNRKFANRTYNKYLSHYTSFMSWYAKEYDGNIRNWFEGIQREKLNTNPESITFEEFERLLAHITPENGIREYDKGVKHLRNYYRPWLAQGFRLALETGRRREEVINLKFSDIEEKNGIPVLIKAEDKKVNRIQNRTKEESKKYIYIPVTNSLNELLNELGYKQNKNMDKYILAPEVEISRNREMSDVLSRGFSHYYKQLNTGRELTFKCLRKTYITNLSLFMGGNTKAITGHSDDAVIERHYLDKQIIAQAAKNFEVFSKEPNRKMELDSIRKEQHKTEKNIEK